MITTVIILGQKEFENSKELIYGKKPLISISGTGIENELGIESSEKTLKLFFDDIPPSTVAMLQHCNIAMLRCCKVFNRFQAKRIIDFLDWFHSDEESHTLVVHCDAGVCRSGAVGKFAQLFFSSMSNENYHILNPIVVPNTWVFDVLCYCLIR
jgi:predicted protein tyrosine phosphatase